MCIQDKLDALPDGSKLTLRDLSLTFPVGLADTCRQAFQVLHDRLLERVQSTSKKSSRENSMYNVVASLLVTAREPLPVTAFGATETEVFHISRLFSPLSSAVVYTALLRNIYRSCVSQWKPGVPLSNRNCKRRTSSDEHPSFVLFWRHNKSVNTYLLT